jgi:hypothetical protein
MDVEMEIFTGKLNATEAEIQKVLDGFWFEHYDSYLDPHAFVEVQGSKQIWWYWNLKYPEEKKKLIYGFVEVNPESIKTDKPVHIRIVCNYIPTYFLWQLLAQRLQNTFILTEFGYSMPTPAQEYFTKDTITPEIKAALLKGFSIIPSDGEVILPQKPSPQDPLVVWFVYYHERKELYKARKQKRYTLRQLAEESHLSYDYVRKCHIGCPLCSSTK